MCVIVRNWIILLPCVSIMSSRCRESNQNKKFLLFVFPLAFFSRACAAALIFLCLSIIPFSVLYLACGIWTLFAQNLSFFFLQIFTCPLLLFSSKFMPLLSSVLSFFSFLKYWALHWSHWSFQNFRTFKVAFQFLFLIYFFFFLISSYLFIIYYYLFNSYFLLKVFF